jgi:hypothetical protein
MLQKYARPDRILFGRLLSEAKNSPLWTLGYQNLVATKT